VALGIHIDLLQDGHRLDRLGHWCRDCGRLSPVEMMVMPVEVLSCPARRSDGRARPSSSPIAAAAGAVVVQRSCVYEGTAD
jgi:hypothetical protein